MDGLRPQHLKDMVGGMNKEHEISLLQSLSQFVNLVLEGGVPAEIRPIFFGASLCALRVEFGPLPLETPFGDLHPRLLLVHVEMDVVAFCSPTSWGLAL